MIHRLLMFFNTYMDDDDFLWIFSRSIKHGSYNVQWKHGLRGLKPDSEVVVLISYKWSKKMSMAVNFCHDEKFWTPENYYWQMKILNGKYYWQLKHPPATDKPVLRWPDWVFVMKVTLNQLVNARKITIGRNPCESSITWPTLYISKFVTNLASFKLSN